MIFLFTGGVFFRISALFVVAIAMITDIIDGQIARSRKMITTLGKLIDPLADKILVTAAFISFVELGLVPAWMVVVIISREFAVTGLRLIASSKGKIIAASNMGKHKTISQMVVIIIILVLLIAKESFVVLKFNADFINLFDYWGGIFIYMSMLVTIVLTMLSGYVYIRNNISLLKED